MDLWKSSDMHSKPIVMSFDRWFKKINMSEDIRISLLPLRLVMYRCEVNQLIHFETASKTTHMVIKKKFLICLRKCQVIGTLWSPNTSFWVQMKGKIITEVHAKKGPKTVKYCHEKSHDYRFWNEFPHDLRNRRTNVYE